MTGLQRLLMPLGHGLRTSRDGYARTSHDRYARTSRDSYARSGRYARTGGFATVAGANVEPGRRLLAPPRLAYRYC